MNVDPTKAGSSTAWDGPEGQRRRALHAALQRLGRTPADLWHDACLLLTDGRFATTTHLVGHALREIDGSLLALLDTGDGSNLEEDDEKRKQKIERIAARPGSRCDEALEGFQLRAFRTSAGTAATGS